MIDRTRAMDSLIALDADLIDDRDVLTTVYLTGFENGRDSERTKVEAQAAEIERLREIVAIMHTAFAAYADSPAKQEAITLSGKAGQ